MTVPRSLLLPSRNCTAAGKTLDAADAAYHRAGARLDRYKRAAYAVERRRPVDTAPYFSSLEQVVAEADRLLAQERRERERKRPRSDTAPAHVAAKATRTVLARAARSTTSSSGRTAG